MSSVTLLGGGRTLHLGAHDAELVEAHRAWRDGDFADDYRRWRPMVERTRAWLVRPGRRVAYRSTAATASGSPTALPPSTFNASSTSDSPHGSWRLAT